MPFVKTGKIIFSHSYPLGNYLIKLINYHLHRYPFINLMDSPQLLIKYPHF